MAQSQDVYLPPAQKAAAPPPNAQGYVDEPLSTIGGHAFTDEPLKASAAATPPPRQTVPFKGGERPLRPGESLPTEEEKRQNMRMVGGGAGALAAGALLPEVAGAGLAIRAVHAAVPVVGAYLGGAGTAGVQGEGAAGMHEAGKSQATLEATGQMLGWPVKFLGKRLLASRVGRYAAEGLTGARAAVNAQLDQTLSKAEAAVRGTKEGVARSVATSKEAAQAAGARVEGAKGQAAASQEAVRARWPEAGPPAAPGAAQLPPMAVSHARAAEPPPLAVQTGNPQFQPVGGEAAFNSSRTPPPSIPRPAPTSAREQVLLDARDPAKLAAADAARARMGAPPPMAVSHAQPDYAAAGREASEVIQGPAHQSLGQLGQAVEDAAASGPAVDMQPIKAKVEALKQQILPATAHDTPEAINASYKSATGSDAPHLTLAEKQQFLQKVNVPVVEATHPLPGVLAAIEAAPDALPMSEAHKYKRLLDEAVNWESPAKRQVQQAAKATRLTLREQMAGHAPYDQATEAYAAAVPLFRKGAGKTIVRNAVENPEAIVRTIKGTEPTKLQMLHDLLIHHAKEGGGEDAGQHAWNSVRSSWTYEHLIKGGVEKFPDRLAKVHPDFRSTMYGDSEGKQVLGNLQQISQAYQQATAQGEAAVATHTAAQGAARAQAATTAAQGRVAIAQKQTERGAIAQSVRDLKRPIATEEAFKASTLAAPQSTTQLAADLAHATLLHGGNVFRTASMARLLFRGPAMNDLVQWAAYSPKGTQLLVRALSGPAPGMAVADLMRELGIRNQQGRGEPPMQASQQPAATPPPGPR